MKSLREELRRIPLEQPQRQGPQTHLLRGYFSGLRLSGIQESLEDEQVENMRRPYHFHPGKLPTREQAQKRWIYQGPFKPVGTEPYADYPRRAREGDGPFEEPVQPRVGEDISHIMLRLQDSGGIGRLAAYTTALGLLGHDHLESGRRTVFSRELFEHRSSTKFKGPPSPVRGDLSECLSYDSFRDIFPSVAVRLNALTSLRWSKDLRASDLFVLWMMIAFEITKKHVYLDHKLLRTVFSVPRPKDNLDRIARGTFSFEEGGIKEEVNSSTPIIVDGQLNPTLIEALVPDGRGEHYGYLELYLLSSMTASWQEQALRGVLAAAVRARIFWSEGGQTQWNLSIDEAVQLFSIHGGSADRLRKERLVPFQNLIESTRGICTVTWKAWGSRLWFNFEVNRDATRRGAPTTGILIDLKVTKAAALEFPRYDYSKARTEDRMRRQTSLATIEGLGWRTAAQRARSDAARRGWEKRRNRGHDDKDRHKNGIPRLPTEAELIEARRELPIFENAPIVPQPPAGTAQHKFDPSLTNLIERTDSGTVKSDDEVLAEFLAELGNVT